MKSIIVYERPSSFVRMDMGILARKYKIYKCRIWAINKWLLPFVWLWSTFRLFFLSLRSRHILVRGGGYHSLIAAMVGKVTRTPVFIVVIGTDAIRMPEINYGHFANRPLGVATGWSYRLATALFPVHHHLIEQDYTFNTSSIEKRQGLMAFVKGLHTPVVEINNGYDAGKWRGDIERQRPGKSFLTVSTNVGTSKRFYVKGIDLFLKLAAFFPKYSFTLVGTVLKGVFVPPNVTVLGHQTPEQLRGLYLHHQFYVQLSRSEGFPNSLCEAMLCGCVPVVSAVGGQVDIVGNVGVIIKENKEHLLKQGIEQAIVGNYRPSEARKRIADEFPLSKRADRLLAEIENRGVYKRTCANAIKGHV